jgi:hypothetical protein
VAIALGCGWEMAELYRELPTGEAAGEQKSTGEASGHPQLPERLPGISNLTTCERMKLRVKRIAVALAAIGSQTGFAWPDKPEPTTAAVMAAVNAANAPDAGEAQRTALKEAVDKLHVQLLSDLTASDYQVGTAYGLGRALAETCQGKQTDTALTEAFRPDRIQQLIVWMFDLTSVLPPHTGHAVTRSLKWWTAAVTAAKAAAAKVAAADSARAKPSAGLPELRRSLHRQGQLWRSVLTEEKQATDLLLLEDYLDAGEQLALDLRPLATQVARALWLPLLVLIGLALGFVVLVVRLDRSVQAQLVAILVAIGGAVGGAWRLISPRVAALLAHMETPLWGAELDTAIAETITLAPVGHGNPVNVADTVSELPTTAQGTKTDSEPAGAAPSAPAPPRRRARRRGR